MRACSIVFISILVIAAYAEDNNPMIPIKWKPAGWTNAELGEMFEPSLTANPIQRYKSHQNLMMTGESPIPNSGDLCVDFARQMVPHHWAAIVMAMDNVNIANWDAEITPLGKKIATSQEKQLDQFLSWLTAQGIQWMGDDFWTWAPNTGKNAAKWSQNIANSDFSGYVSKMHGGMIGTTLTGDLNLDFARQMIPHHWAAVEMSEDVLESGNCDAEIVSIAQNVHTTQSQQILQFRAWLTQVGWDWQGEDWTPNPITSQSLRGSNLQAIIGSDGQYVGSNNSEDRESENGEGY